MLRNLADELNGQLLKYLLLATLGYLCFNGCIGETAKITQQDVRTVALNFFDSLRTETIHDVYLMTHPTFRSKTTLREFALLIKIYNLSELQDFKIDQISEKNDLWHLEGKLELKTGEYLPVDLKVAPTEKNVELKLLHLSFDLKAFVISQGMELPNLEMKYLIARRTLQDFQRSLRDFRMDRFYDSISEIWRKQTTLDEFNRIYMPMMRDPFISDDFATGNLSLEAISGVNESGLLRLRGKVSASLSYYFDSDFFFANGHWNLVRFEMTVN